MERFHQYEKVYSDFEEFFDRGELQKQLDGKVEKSLFVLVNDQKVHKKDSNKNKNKIVINVSGNVSFT